MKNSIKTQTIFKNKKLAKSQLAIFENSLSLVIKSKFYLITTTIFFVLLLIVAIFWSQFILQNETIDQQMLKILGFWLYVIICMCYLFVFNLTNLVKFFGDQRQNGIYDLELRKGKSSKAIFWQRLAVNKLFSFAFIVFAIILYYIVFIFTKNQDMKYLMVNLFAPGLWFLVVFDSLITALILLISLGNKITLTASLISIFSIILFFFPLFMMIGSGVGENSPQLTIDGQLSLYYAKDINEIRNKYKDGIIDKMVLGDSDSTDFTALSKDEWKVKTENPNSAISLGTEAMFNFNTQLLFNGLIPDSKSLLGGDDAGVLEKNQNGETFLAKYISTQETNGLTQAQNTYFNQFFQKKADLFQVNGQGYSYAEWQKTIFNVHANFFEKPTEKVLNNNSAENYLIEALDGVSKSLSLERQKAEWAELRPIVLSAFKAIYVLGFDRDVFASSGYLNKNNIFKADAAESANSVHKIILGPNGNSGVVHGGESEWYWPVLTLDHGGDSKLTSFQTKLFQKMTIKPGTRELMSILASLISNSLLVPRIFSNDTQNFTASDIRQVQTKKFLTNPFTWINSMLIFNKPNLSFIDQLRIQQNLSSTEVTSLKNYYVNVQETDKFSNSQWYPNLINSEIEISNPNFNWQDIEIVKASFSPLWALVGSFLTNLAVIGFSYWLFKITLIK